MRYVHTGTLTGTIPAEKVGLAQDYLARDDMTKYFTMWNKDLKDVVLYIRWNLSANGHDYTVEAITTRVLDEAELTVLNDWVSGQNSDGLGEGFEQQPFAEIREEGGSSWSWDDGDEDEDDVYGGMISFDWKTNDVDFRLFEPAN